MQAIKSIGKGQAALNDFWATMNVCYRGLHHNTYQEHLKKTFSPAAASAAENITLLMLLGTKETEDSYQEWRKNHQCQKNTNVGAGRMEVEAALELFRRSLSKSDLRYTTIVCNGDCRTYLTLCADETYGFMRLTKEDCVNHVQKRMGTILRGIFTKSRKKGNF
ncbi:hypothetical protein HPB48_024428 [Haemaphysalis longicornis]|uniref:Mutator-like transposase domain-containing protein n=1 Tax=Haemaphysalis longicornis TaxID=44386 RepID=A0A9J6H7T0_HAELO|nr:hypothetical protein HPB48_024428 [Haemaphysalis longicornis]